MNSINKNISRLSFHDSHLENLERKEDLTIVTFDWGYLGDFLENGYENGIVIGKCRLLISGLKDEEFRIYRKGTKYDIEKIPEDINKCWDVIANTGIDEKQNEIILDGMFTRGSESNWIEWKFNYEVVKLEWNSFVTNKEWENGKLPED